jgi:hypothetical protein
MWSGCGVSRAAVRSGRPAQLFHLARRATSLVRNTRTAAVADDTGEMQVPVLADPLRVLH